MPRNSNSTTRCQHRTKDHKRCQMPAAPPVTQTSARPREGVRVPSPPTLCPHHQRTAANQIYQSAESGRRPAHREDGLTEHHLEKDPAEIANLATQLLAGTSDLSTPASVNLLLGNLLTQLAHNKISRRNAIAMAYISQLLLNSISVKYKQDRGAQAAQLQVQAQAEAEGARRIVIDMPRPQHDAPADDDPCHNSSRCSGGSSDPCLSPSLRNGESSDSHSVAVDGSAESAAATPSNSDHQPGCHNDLNAHPDPALNNRTNNPPVHPGNGKERSEGSAVVRGPQIRRTRVRRRTRFRSNSGSGLASTQLRLSRIGAITRHTNTQSHPTRSHKSREENIREPRKTIKRTVTRG
jgi:hypothetical protein